MKILALDIATHVGFAHGDCGAFFPAFGAHRFASPGASHEAIFGNALIWARDLLKEVKPDRIVYEAPLATSFTRGRTNRNTTEVLHGLPAVILGTAHVLGFYDIRRAEAGDIRMHFIGTNPKRDKAKRLTIRRCHLLGWKVLDDNAADACALFDFACGMARAHSIEATMSGGPMHERREQFPGAEEDRRDAARAIPLSSL